MLRRMVKQTLRNLGLWTVALAAVLCLVGGTARGELLVYEGFDYPLGEPLNGQTPATGLGMTGSWTANDNNADRDQLVVEGDGRVNNTPGGANDPEPDVEWDGIAANVPVTGYFISIGGNGHVWSKITMDSSVTDTFVDGSVTWMSVIAIQGDVPWGYWPLLAIGAGGLIEDRGTNAEGQAIGGGAAFPSNNAGNVGAHYWNDENAAGPHEIHVSAATVPSTINVRPRIPYLMVFKITWSDAGNDTVEAFQFSVATGAPAPTEADFVAGAVSNAAALDQSQFDTLSFAGGRAEFDEIRIGTTFNDVIGIPSEPALEVTLEPASPAAAVVGSAFVTTATASGATTHTMSWSFEPASAPGTTDTIVGSIVNSSDNGSSVSVLTLNPVTADHMGTYTIVATDGATGTTASASLFFGLVPLALEVEPASPAAVVTNDVFVATATASNATTYTMVWSFEPASAPGTSAPIDGAFVNSPVGASMVSVLTLNPAHAGQAGTYTVVALGSEGTGASAELVLTILPPVAISVLPPSASILEGTVDFVATATATLGKAPYQSMSWTKDGAPVNSGDLGGRLTINTDLITGVSVLTVSGLVKANNDAGLYECTVVDDTGTPATDGSLLYVRDVNDIFVEVDPAWDQVTSGSVYVVTGRASRGTLPYASINWTKGGVPLVSGGLGGRLLIETSPDNSFSTLTLTGVSQAADAGYFLCEAVDSSGTTGTAIAVLVVGDILRLASDNPSATLGPDATYVVTATATGGSLPYASFEWTGPNGPIASGVVTVGNRSTLTIGGAQNSHSGTYTCTVTDDDGVAVGVQSMLTVGENLKARVKHWTILD